jgi:nucleotide-binding universal stress UspA family protein
VFRDSCRDAGVEFSIDPDSDVTIQELIDHSAFSDLILCDSKGEMGGLSLRELLVDTHCPVLLVPEKAILPERAVFCYDESFSSIYALKMYSYLFPEWKDLPGVLLSINPKGDNGSGYDEYLADWLPQHFTNIEQEAPAGNLQRELVSFIRRNDEATIVVMGSFGRNAISRLFHKSLANVVLEETNASVFIMHE